MPTRATNGFLLVHSLCELANASVDDALEGCLAFVVTTGQFFRMSMVSPAPTPDGFTVISTNGGPSAAPCVQNVVGTGIGRWILQNNGDFVNPFASVVDWFIDPVSGLDTNTGLTGLSPLKTFQALAARWAGITSYNTAAVNVHILHGTTLAAGDQVVLNRPGNPAFPILINGYQTILTTGTVTNFTPINRVGNVSSQLNGTLALGTWANYINKIVVITGSATPSHIGAWALVVEDLGGGVAKTTPFVAQLGPTSEVLVHTNPSNGDTYQIVSPFELADGTTGQMPFINVGEGTVWFHDCTLSDDLGQPQLSPYGIQSAFKTYWYRGAVVNTNLFPILSDGLFRTGNTYLSGNLYALSSDIVLDSTLLSSPTLLTRSGTISVVDDSILSPTTSLTGCYASSFYFADFDIDKAASPAINLDVNPKTGNRPQALFDGSIYGTNVPTTHISLHTFGRASYTANAHFYALVTINQHPLDFQNGVVKDYADLPFASVATFADSYAAFLAKQ